MHVYLFISFFFSLLVSIIGIISYNYYKLSKDQNSEKGQYQMIPLHSNPSSIPSRNLDD